MYPRNNIKDWIISIIFGVFFGIIYFFAIFETQF